MADTQNSGSTLPSGGQVCKSIPDVLMIPEIIIGGAVWILVAITRVLVQINQGWVMFGSIFLFFFSLLFLIGLLIGFQKGAHYWKVLDVIYHAIAAGIYFSVAVLQANATLVLQDNGFSATPEYKLNVAATVLSFIITVIYVVHAALSFKRAK
ncbi:myelin and lymphocyte protein-like [Polypterus senegalus]|uniref:myelin and lymphocyte protein-like n=1 Tax=Polypterus senegalus TaxID=55291 RepID=UPI001966549B|nr:myelin and lymphocyte protein-like [Polypterus senegalus]